MMRALPFPALSLGLFAMWLLLNRSAAPGHLLLGAALAVAGGLMLAMLQPPAGRARRRALVVAQLVWLVFIDIARSNLAVARIVLHPRMRSRRSGFISMPLAVHHPGALAALACIITATPGTSWARYDTRRNVLTIHILDLIDEEAWIRLFKDRYERRLKEIFQ